MKCVNASRPASLHLSRWLRPLPLVTMPHGMPSAVEPSEEVVDRRVRQRVPSHHLPVPAVERIQVEAGFRPLGQPALPHLLAVGVPVVVPLDHEGNGVGAAQRHRGCKELRVEVLGNTPEGGLPVKQRVVEVKEDGGDGCRSSVGCQTVWAAGVAILTRLPRSVAWTFYANFWNASMSGHNCSGELHASMLLNSLRSYRVEPSILRWRSLP